jgi:hypothetical protein
MKEKMMTIITLIRNRRKMVIYGNAYSSIIDFLNGYDSGMEEYTGKSILKEFQAWLHKKLNKDFSAHWSGYILNEMANGNENDAEKMLFDLMEEFLKTI